MSEGIGEATQVVKVTMEGTELFIKAAYMTIKEIASLIIAYKSYKEKTMSGEVKLKKLLEAADGDIRLLKIPEDKKEEVAKALKKYQIKYSLMPDLNLADGKCEFGFAVTDLPRVNSLIESLKLGEVISQADYVKNGDPEILDKLANNIAENEKKELATVQVADKRFITVSEELVAEETENALKTRVPGTWGENVRYLWLDKDKVKDINDDKTILTYLDKNKEYELFSVDDKVVDTIKGEILGEEHYDSVSEDIIKQFNLLDTMPEKAIDFNEQVKANEQALDSVSRTRITIPETCVVKKTDTQVKIKLPKEICRSDYRKSAYIWMPVKDVLADKENQKIILLADFGSKHMVYDKNDNVIDTMVTSRLKNTFDSQKVKQKTELVKKTTTKSIGR
jgi:hypothetical protein